MTISEWIEQYRGLDGRFETMKKALELLHEREGKVIIETGTTRMKDDWGAGMSTFVFGSYCKEFGGHITTVDISFQNMSVCREVTKDFTNEITYIISDSLLFLTLFQETIDLLYLDSVDCPIEILTEKDQIDLMFAQNHQLNEAKIALPKVSEKGLILLDDNQFSFGGKTALTKVYLKEQGWKELLGSQQSLWSKI